MHSNIGYSVQTVHFISFRYAHRIKIAQTTASHFWWVLCMLPSLSFIDFAQHLIGSSYLFSTRIRSCTHSLYHIHQCQGRTVFLFSVKPALLNSFSVKTVVRAGARHSAVLHFLLSYCAASPRIVMQGERTFGTIHQIPVLSVKNNCSSICSVGILMWCNVLYGWRLHVNLNRLNFYDRRSGA